MYLEVHLDDELYTCIYLEVHLDGVVDERLGEIEPGHHVVDGEVTDGRLQS